MGLHRILRLYLDHFLHSVCALSYCSSVTLHFFVIVIVVVIIIDARQAE